MPKLIRIFTGIELPRGAKRALGAFIHSQRIKADFADESNLHITLRFIGEVDEGGFEQARLALDALTAEAFSLTLSGVGSFGNLLWVGVKRPCEGLFALEREVTARLTERGLPFDAKEYSPHITVARRAFGELSGEPAEVSFPVRAATLFESTRTPAGMLYTPRFQKTLEVRG